MWFCLEKLGECIYVYYKMFILNIHAPDCLILFPCSNCHGKQLPQLEKKKTTQQLVFMVQICQISVIALSVLSNYPFLCISVEHRTPLCQNGRGRGESDNQFPMEIFFIFFFLLYPKGRDTRSGSGKDRL